MGKHSAMDSAPSSPPAEDAILSAETSPLPADDGVCKDTPWEAVFSGHARSGACCASPCVSSSSEVDLTPVEGHVAGTPPTAADHPFSPASVTINGDTYAPVLTSTVHAVDCTSFQGSLSLHASMLASAMFSSMHVGQYTLFSENDPMDAELPASTSLSSGQVEDGTWGSSHCPQNSFPSNQRSLTQHAFVCSYINTLLPVLRMIHSQSLFITLDEKASAVKLAADMSLAVSAVGNNAWSQALLREVASTSICRSLLCSRPKTRRRRKPARKKVSSSYISALNRRSRSRSIAHKSFSGKGLKNIRMSRGSGKALYMADLRSHDSHAFAYSPECSPLLMEPMHVQIPCSKSRWSVARSGRSSYLRILKSTRYNRKQRSMKATPVSEDNEVSRASTPVISKEQIESLGGLVPGGQNMDVPRLLEEAADYILTLQMQVEALQSLSRMVSPDVP